MCVLNRMRRECHENWMSGGGYQAVGEVEKGGGCGRRGGGLSEERWDGREKQLQIIVGWGRKGYRKVVDEPDKEGHWPRG